MDHRDFWRPPAWLPWIGALLVAGALCGGYFGMPVFRGAWQTHYPELADAWANNGRFSLIGWFGTELSHEELAYAARTNNAAHHFPAFDPYIKDNHSRRQLVIDALTYTVMGAIQAVFRDINRTWLFTRFFCCVFWFVLIYFLMLRMSPEVPFAILGATFVTCFSYILTLLFLHNLTWSGLSLSGLAHNAWTALSYGRTEAVLRLPRPGLTYAFLFLATLLSIKTAESGSWKWAAASGLLGGALAYVRLDVWTAHLLAAYAFSVVYSWKTRRPHWPLMASAVIATIVSLPFLYCIYPPAPDMLLSSACLYRRQFDLASLAYAAAFVLGLRFKKRPTELFLACMAAGVFVMVNIELVTGYTLSSDHWKFFGNIYVFLLALSFVPQRLKEKSTLCLVGAAILALIAFLQGLGYAAIHFPFQGIPKDYDQGLAWLERHTPPDSVVLTLNPEVNTLIPVFTHDKVELSFVLAVVSDYPLLSNSQRLMGGLRILGADTDRFLKECVFPETSYDRRTIVATGLYRGEIEKSVLYTMLFYMTPPAAARRILEQARARPAAIGPDYIWFGGLEKQYAGRRFPEPGLWQEVYRNASVIIYSRKTGSAGGT
jgi:hypothetical protein